MTTIEEYDVAIRIARGREEAAWREWQACMEERRNLEQRRYELAKLARESVP